MAGFASLQGAFGFEMFTPVSGPSTFIIGATGVNLVLGTADTNLTITGASLGLLIQGGKFDLVANAPNVALNGVPDLSISASALQVEIEHGLDPASVTGGPTSINILGSTVNLDFSALPTGTNAHDITSITGMAAINVANFVSLSGSFSFSEASTKDADGKGTTTVIVVGATGVNAFIGVPSTTTPPAASNAIGVQISNASLALAIYRDSEASGSTYALQASAGLALVGLPANVIQPQRNRDVVDRPAAGADALNQTASDGVTPLFSFGTLSPNLSSVAVTNPGANATVTVTMGNNPFVVGQSVTIAGNSGTNINGTFTVTAVTATTFSYTSANAVAGTGGTISGENPANLKSFRRLPDALTIGGAFTLMGNFSFTQTVDGNISKLLVGATNISAPSLTADAAPGHLACRMARWDWSSTRTIRRTKAWVMR